MFEPKDLDILDGWDPPPLREEAANWLLSQLSPRVLLRFARAVAQDPEGQTALSGFRITRDSMKKPGVKQAVTARLVSLLMSSKWATGLFFLITFPHGRWFMWSEVLDVHSEIWLELNWRDLIRGTGDPGLAVALSLDDRPSLARRGERALRTRLIWTGELTGSKEMLPSAWAEFSKLLGAEEHTNSHNTEELENLQLKVEDLSAKLRRAEQEEVRLNKLRKKLDPRIRDLEAKCLERDSLVKELKESLKERSRRIKAFEKEMDAEIRARVDTIYREFFDCDMNEKDLWKDSLKGESQDLLERVDRALMAQRQADARYGTRSRVCSKINKLESKYKEVKRALGDALVPAQSLLKAGKDLQLEITQWRQMLPGGEEAGSPLAESLLGQARSFRVNEKGIKELETLATDLDRPPLESLLSKDENAYLHRHIQGLLAERRKILQACMVARHPPVRILTRRVQDISNLSAFVLRNHDLCSGSVLLVDGYNAIKTSAEWALLDRQNFTRARERFIDLWESRAKDWKRVELVFDGQEKYLSVDERDHMTVVFTDTKFETQKADLYILSRIQDINADHPKTKLFLITADMELRDSVSEWCDYFIEPRWALIPYLSTED